MKRTLWRHFSALVLLIFFYSMARHASMLHEGAQGVPWKTVMWAALLEAPSDLFKLFPLAPAIAIATSRLGTSVRRGSLQALAVTMLCMVLLDVAVAPSASLTMEQSARRAPTTWPSPSDTLLRLSPMDSIGVLRSAARLVAERPRAMHQLLRAYPQDHARYVAVSVIAGTALFTLPFILIGLVLGTSSWLRRRVIFRSAGDAIAARWFIAWVTAPAAMALIGTWSDRGFHDVLFRGESLGLPLVPFVPFLVLGALGWHAALKLSGFPDASIEDSISSPTPSRFPAA